MHRIDGPGATVDNKFTDGDPVGGVPATLVTDDWLNDIQENLMAVLAAAGVAPVKGNSGQLLASLTGRILNTQVFSASGTSTYTPTVGTKKIRVRVIGGGGGGGGCAATTASNAAAGAGGSGGGYAESIITSGFSGVSIVVGAGGTAGVAGANNGGNGGGSSFGTLLSATGGGGGSGSPAVTPPYSVGSDPAGIGAGGSINAQGSGGSPSIITIISGNYQSGVGGGSSFGGGASQRRFGDQGAGRQGVGPGAGGSGAAAGGSTTTGAMAGGAGAPGIVIVEEYF
jgi:hypothetical protein